MSNILSAIPGQFSKSLILGTLIPVVFFVILWLILVMPLLPDNWQILKPLEVLGTGWQLVIISFVSILLSGLLYNFNIPIIRLYEGYPWKDSWIGKRRTNYYKNKFNATRARWRGIRTLLEAMDKLNSQDERISEIEKLWTKIGQSVNNDFSSRMVLPTQLGNIIASFENYPYHQYRIAAITLWPRLIAKIDNEYFAMINDAKTSFDFTLNSSVLSGVLALLILLAGLVYPTQLTSLFSLGLWLIEIIGFMILAYWLYILSLSRAHAWGVMIKGAFDLYRWDLLRQLGYTRVPTTQMEERALWDDISVQMIYGDSPNVRLAEYTTLPTFAHGEPYVVDLEITRGVSKPAKDGAVTVTLQVKNTDAKKRSVEDVIVTDTLANDFDYEWDSASIGNQKVPIVGTNPYHFKIGDLDYNNEKTLTYRILLRKK